MQIIIMSDNHRDEEIVRDVLRQNPQAERYYLLGDSEMRKHVLVNLGVISVKGNYPFEPKLPKELILTIEGVRVLMVHGHKQHVKTGIERIKQYAYDKDSQLVFFGHTHKYRIYDAGEMILVNPGSLTLPRGHHEKTYAKATINKNHVRVEIIDVDNQKTLNSFEKILGETDG